MRVCKPPEAVDRYAGETHVFLAGTIDMGGSDDWQAEVTEKLSKYAITLLNPRRDDWDSTWDNTIDNPVFREQVMWELDNLYDADCILMYLAPGSHSPISMMELGLYASMDIIVVCPEGFWRKGNIDVMGEYYGFKVLDTLDEGLEEVIRRCTLREKHVNI